MRLNDDVKFGLLFVVVLASLLVQCYRPKHDMIAYDCRLVNISPDLPPKVIEECRKQQYEWSQKHKEKPNG